MNLRQKKKIFKKRYKHNPPKWLTLNSLTLNPEYMKTVLKEMQALIIEDLRNLWEEQLKIKDRCRRICNLETVNQSLTRRNHERRKKYNW